MMEAVLLLCACFCVGLSYADLEYGSSYTMRLSRKANSVTFTPLLGSDVMILWKRGDPPASEDSRWKVTGSLFQIHSLTQKDSGIYIVRDKDQSSLSVRTIRVVARKMSFRNDKGESFSFDHDLEPTSCNIYFIPEGDLVGHQIVHHGRLRPSPVCSGFNLLGSCGVSNINPQESCNGQYEVRDSMGNEVLVVTVEVEGSRKMSFRNDEGESFSFDHDLEPTSCNIYFIPEGDSVEHQIVHHGRLRPSPVCSGFYLLGSCGVTNNNPKESCSGQYEVRDSMGNEVLVVTVEVEGSSSFDTKKIGLGFGIFFAVVSCCGCLKRCCCGKSSSKEEQPETPDEEPAVHYHEYDHEPVGPGQEQLYPAQPSHTPSVPLIHNPPTTVPPAYSEIFSSPAESTVAPTFAPTLSPTVAPTVPVQSDSQPRFELKGTSFSSAPPLSSDSPYGDVYTSEKLNFL